MANRIALVTGANKGIGFEVCRQLAGKGFLVFLAARNPEAGTKAATSLAHSGKVIFIQLDVTDPESIRKAVKDVSALANHLDVLINNAAVLLDDSESILELEPKNLEETLRTNVVGVLRVTQAFWPLLLKSDAGRVVNVSSGVSILSEMESYAPAYSISKTALNAVTRQFAATGKSKRIAVNSVTPGWVRTDMGGSSAPKSVEEGADSLVWLASDAPQNLTGSFVQDRKVTPW